MVGAQRMGLHPDSYHWCLWLSGAGPINRSPRQQLSKDPEWCWMEAGPAFSLPFADASASAGSRLLPDGSCPTCSVLYRPSINFPLFGPHPSELVIPSPIMSELSVPEQPSHFQLIHASLESACKKEMAVRTSWGAGMPGTSTLNTSAWSEKPPKWCAMPSICSDFADPSLLWFCKILRNVFQPRQEDGFQY